MKKLFQFLLAGMLFILASCSHEQAGITMASILTDAPSIEGNAGYLDSPYVTAGNRTYLVGHQNGSFPEIGWHIKGEMGGLWDHPIKLMDGFDTEITVRGTSVKLNNASRFINYPLANMHLFELDEQHLNVERWQFVPDHTEGLFLQYRIYNPGASDAEISLRFTGYSDLRPTWLGEESGMIDSSDEAEYREDMGCWVIRDAENPWYVVFGSDQSPSTYTTAENPYGGKGLARSLEYRLNVPKGESGILSISIGGSYTGKEEALATFRQIRREWSAALENKKMRYRQLASQSRVTIPDKQLEKTFEWLKYNCDWLIRTVPEIGSGITAGIPDYPWWFGVDSEYALKGYMAIGQSDAVYNTIALLDSVSEVVNGNGRILHEMSTNGIVFNKGNINETPQFASLIWEIYQWNGDLEFLERYYPTVKKGLDWLLTENDSNKNLFPDGFGMMEIHGLDSEMIDVAAYTQRAFSDAAKMASQLQDTPAMEHYQQLASQLKERINTHFWSPEFKSYADFLGTDSQALHLIEDAIIRADTLKKPWAVRELQETARVIRQNPSSDLRPFVVHHNWVVNTPMEMKIADSVKAVTALKTAENFVNPFGMFVTGIDRDASAGTDEGSFEGSKQFSYTGAVMTLPTGVQAVAENNYGRPDKALEYLQRMSRSFSYALPGSMYEVSPDYGMVVQAWNIYSFAIPIVQQFFGIQPRAYERRVLIQPQFPGSWEDATIENVQIADNEISVYYKLTDGRGTLRLEQANTNWTMQLKLANKKARDYRVVEGDASVDPSGELKSFSTTGNRLVIEWNETE